jgi:nicotinamidase-related amidase
VRETVKDLPEVDDCALYWGMELLTLFQDDWNSDVHKSCFFNNGLDMMLDKILLGIDNSIILL